MHADIRLVSPDELLSHASAMRALAGDLVGAREAEDAVQDAWVTALERPPRDTGSLRSWMRVVVANLARNAHRSAARRREREEWVARPESEEAGEQALERFELQRVLCERLVALPDEQRTVVYLRYYEDLTPTAIAARLGVPVKTVKTRHTRALASLRAELDERSGGDRAAWAAVLAPWVRLGSASALGPTVAVAALLVVALGGWLGWRATRAPEQDTRLAELALEVPPTSAAPARVEARRESLAPAPVPPSAPAVAGPVLSGTVRLREDAATDTRKPLAGVGVVARVRGVPEPMRVLTDESGAFRFEWPRAVHVTGLTAESTPTTTPAQLFPDLALGAGSSETLELVVTRGETLRGTVVDKAGAPVAGAEVRAWCRRDFDPERAPDRRARTASDGSFQIEHLGPEFCLTAEARGLVCAWGLRGRLLEEAGARGLEVVMALPTTLRGTVVSARGAPIGGAQIAVRAHGSTSDRDATRVVGIERFQPISVVSTSAADGSFELGPVPEGPWSASVSHPEFLPSSSDLDPAHPDTVVVLDPGQDLSGRVLDPHGKPLAGAEVSARTPGAYARSTTGADGGFTLRPLEASENAFVRVEADGHALCARQPVVVGAGGDGFLEFVLEPPVRIAGRVRDPAGRPLAFARLRVEGERLLVYDGVDYGERTTWEWAAGRNEAVADADGRFAFEPLYEGEFELLVSPAATPRAHASFRVRAGREDLDLEVDVAALERVVFAGRVTDARTGEPVVGSTLTPMALGPGGSRSGRNVALAPDAEGRFRLAGFEPGSYQLIVSAPGYAPWRAESRDFGEGEHVLDLRLWPSCAFELVAEDEHGRPVSAEVGFEDLEGLPLPIEWGAGASSGTLSVPSEPIAVQGLPRRPIRIRARGSGYQETILELDLSVPPSEPVRLVLRRDPLRIRVECSLVVLSSDDPSLAELSDLDELRPHYLEGRVTTPDAVIEVDFEDEHGRTLAQARIEPRDGTYAWEWTVQSERQMGTAEGPAIQPELPLAVVAARVRAVGHLEELVPMRIEAEHGPDLVVVLLRTRR